MNGKSIEISDDARFNPALWLSVGYLFLFIFRPFEYWVWLGDYRIERIYMIAFVMVLFIWQGRQYYHHEINSAFLVFLCVLGISSLASNYLGTAKMQLWEQVKLATVFFALLLSVRDYRELRVIVVAFIVITGVYIGKSMWEFFVHDKHFFRMGIKRLIGIDKSFNDPNTFGATIVYSMPFAWALLKSSRNRLFRIGLIGYGLMSVCAIGFTGSRSAFLTLIVFLFLVWKSSSKKVVSGLLIAGVLLAGLYVLPGAYQQRFATIVDDSINRSATESADSRTTHLKWGFKLYRLRPVLGWGPGTAPLIVEDIIGHEKRLQLHSLYGQTLAELGTVGALAFVFVVGLCFRTKKRSLVKLKQLSLEDRLIYLIPVACTNTLWLLLFEGLFGHNLYRFTWFWVGVLLVIVDSLAVSKDYDDDVGLYVGSTSA